MAKQYAIQDQNRFPGLLGHSGTAGTADTIRLTANTDGSLKVPTELGSTINTNIHTGKVELNVSIEEIETSVIFPVKLVDEAGTAYGVKHIQNKPRVSSMPYTYDIAEGNVTGHTPWSKIGYQPASDTTLRAMWNVASDYIFPTVAQQMEVISTSAQDGVAGTGALTVKIYYLDGNYAEKTTTVTMNGVSAVPTGVSDIFRINSFRVITVGTSNAAVGTITLRHLSDTPIYSQIAPNNNRARCFVYTVPLGKTLYITNISFSVGYSSAGKRVTFSTKANYNNLDSSLMGSLLFQTYSEVILVDNAINIDLQIPTKFPEKVDLKMTVIGETNAECSCGARGWIENN